jgi:short-subunit dehydrogenase
LCVRKEALTKLGENASKVNFEKLDVCDQKSIDSFAKSLGDRKVDTLVNNAGTLSKETMDPESIVVFIILKFLTDLQNIVVFRYDSCEIDI